MAGEESKFLETLSDKKYVKAVYDLTLQTFIAEKTEDHTKICMEFCQNYLTLGWIWEKIYRKGGFETHIARKKFLKQEIYHFYFNHENARYLSLKLLRDLPPHHPHPERHYLFVKNSPLLKTYEKYLKFPHYKLRQVFMMLEECSPCPLSKKLYEQVAKMEKLYRKIKFAENNFEAWTQCLEELGDPEFLRQNVEYRIGKNLDDKKLWKLYISYLRENDSKEMLQVYSKYCRFFLEDFEIKTEYKNAVDKFGPVYVPWKNLFNFENALTLIEEEIKQKEYPPPKIPYQHDQSKKNFVMKDQIFSLPKPLIKYFIDFAPPRIYSNLQKVCKYFFIKKPKLYCHRFFLNSHDYATTESVAFKANSFGGKEFTEESMKKFEAKKLILMNSIYIMQLNFGNDILSKIIKNCIYDCDLKYIDIHYHLIPESDFNFLTYRGNVEHFHIYRSRIIKPDGNLLMVEDILVKLPKIRNFHINMNDSQSLSTTNTLSKLDFHYPIIIFSVSTINNDLDENDFCEFVKKNMAADSQIYLSYHETFDPDARKISLKAALKKVLDEWKPYDERPKIHIGLESV